jgi:hypothetical protein
VCIRTGGLPSSHVTEASGRTIIGMQRTAADLRPPTIHLLMLAWNTPLTLGAISVGG